MLGDFHAIRKELQNHEKHTYVYVSKTHPDVIRLAILGLRFASVLSQLRFAVSRTLLV